MQTLYLSRRNLQTLINKLDRVRAGGSSACTLIKQDTVHPKYPSTDAVTVIAIEDETYYGTASRSAGEVLREDVPKKAFVVHGGSPFEVEIGSIATVIPTIIEIIEVDTWHNGHPGNDPMNDPPSLR